jgi:hypothetical protein
MSAQIDEVSIAVEGLVDHAVLQRLLDAYSIPAGPAYGMKGKADLRRRLDGFNAAARQSRWLVLADLDSNSCPPSLKSSWLPAPQPGMCFRVAVREIEAWLLADRRGISEFLRVSMATVPPDPEALSDPKGSMVALARRSRSRVLREGMVPDPMGERSTGKAYASYLIEFATRHWSHARAMERSPSLARAIASLTNYSRSGSWI